jgi:V8-like Glu-specific endopeptidase
LFTKPESRWGFWDLAASAEASVTLGNFGEACQFLAQAVRLRKEDVFALSSVLRQFTDVWQLNSHEVPGSTILPMLRSALLDRGGGSITIEPSEAAAAPSVSPSLREAFGSDAMVSVNWYQTGLERCRGVARIESTSGSPFGTGFVVRGSQLDSRFGEEYLLLTAAHVIGDETTHALLPGDASVRFESLGASGPSHQVSEMLWHSPTHKLDVSLLRLAPPLPESYASYPFAKALPEPGDRVYLIGYAGGRSLSFSLHDNLLLARNETFLHYRAPTEGGSSGSPIFDHSWRLIGIHHAGGQLMRRLDGEGTYEANEGISLHAIITAMRATPG